MAVGNVVEAGLFSLYGAKQAGGTLDVSATPGVAVASVNKRFSWISGDFSAQRDDGSENWSSGSAQRFRDGVDYVNTITGSGEPVIPGHPSSIAQLSAWFLGSDVVSSVSAQSKHVLRPSTQSAYLTFLKVIGQNGKVVRRYANSRISQLAFECTKQSQLLKVTTSIQSVNPEIFEPTNASVAATAQPAERPFTWADMIGGFSLDTGPGTLAVQGSEVSLNVAMNDALNLAYGEGVNPIDVLPGDSEVTFTFTMTAAAESVARLAELIYGTATPASGNQPTPYTQLGVLDVSFVKKDPSTGSAFLTSDATNYGALRLYIPGAYFTPTAAIAPNPDGSPTEISFAGRARLTAGNPMIQIEVTAPTAQVTSSDLS